jgi:uncharacterized protein
MMNFNSVLLTASISMLTVGNAYAVNQGLNSSQAVYQLEFNAANHFADITHSFSATFMPSCKQGDIAELRVQWREMMAAWMKLQGQQRGPEKALQQSWNVQFWPDKKDTTGHKMRALAKSPQHWNLDSIAKAGVTVQGLGALEWLLYDSSSELNISDVPNDSVCQLGAAISTNLTNKAEIIAAEWRVNPWQQFDQTAWIADYVALLSNQLEFTISKLVRPMANIGQPRPYFAESWRSLNSLNNIKANIEAIQMLYLADGHGLDAELRRKGLDDVALRMSSQLENIMQNWPEQAELFNSLQTKDGYRSALSLRNKLEQLSYLLHDEVAVGLGVVVGFNATDGD